METLHITEHSKAGWSSYATEFGLVPDPMILRTGEVFLNGARGVVPLERGDFVIWDSIRENLGGLLDFFDMLVTRDRIPLINYNDTFDRRKIMAPLDLLLPDRTQPVEVASPVYNEIKKGALLNLGEIDPQSLVNFGHVARELNAFRYEWEPELRAPGAEPDVLAAQNKFMGIDEETRRAATFLLGGFIFSGFAQASGSTHYIQPKRARFFLGVTAAPDQAGNFGNQQEDEIFAVAAARLAGTDAAVRNTDPVPPMLPYLFKDGEPRDVKELLARATAFRDSPEGKTYRRVVNEIRADGVQARRAEDAVRLAREDALAFLAPYSKLQADRSRSLDIDLSVHTEGLPFVQAEAKTSVRLRIPTWLRLWWNDRVPFGGVQKTLRRMWMTAESYNDLSGKLERVWARS
jgi:hypothetical protein